MFSKIYTRWMTGAALTLALAGNLLGAGAASAQTMPTALSAAQTATVQQAQGSTSTESLSAQMHASLEYKAAAALAPGTAFTYQLTVTNDGPGDAQNTWVALPLDANVVVDDFTSADTSIFVESLDADQITIRFGNLGPVTTQTVTIYAHVLASAPQALSINSRATVTWDDAQAGMSSVSNTVPLVMGAGAPAPAQMPALQTDASGPVAAGTILTITGSAFGGNEAASFWLNVPAGTVLAEESLGQADTAVQSTAVGLDALGKTDADGALSYTLDTTGLPSGTYSLVAHGWATGLEEVVSFTIQ